MRTAIYFVPILVAYLVTASPLNHTSFPTAVPNLGIVNDVAYDTNPPPPGGPDDFKIRVNQPNAVLNRESSLMYVAKVLMDEAIKDFHGSFEEATTVFRDETYPHLAVKASVLETGQRLPRRYFLWGMAHIIRFMVDREQFFERDFLLTWRDASVGRITWMLVDIPDNLMNGYNATTLAQPTTNQTNPTASSTGGENDLSWRYISYGELMTLTDIAMGTIASLIQAAQLSDQNFETFVGYWPQSHYLATQSWGSISRPPRLNKYFLVRSMFASLTYAHDSRNFHEVYAAVAIDDELVFATGGYTKSGAQVAGKGLDISIS